MNRLILTVLLLLLAPILSAQSFYDLQQIPRDSITAEQSKIWIPVENKSCSVTVKILDKDNNLIRTLVDRKLYNGYYNIYWDKKNDSARFVRDTTYKVAVLACNYRKIYPIKISYQRGERAALITAGTDENIPSLTVHFLEDSTTASLEIYNSREFFTDSLFHNIPYNQGNQLFQWTPSPRIPSGKYFYKLTLNGYEHWLPFKYKR